MFSDPDLLQKFWLVHLRLGIFDFSPSIGVNTSFALSLRAWSSDASVFSYSLMSATTVSPFQTLSAENTHPKNFPWQDSKDRIDAVSRSLSQRQGDIRPLVKGDNCSAKEYSEPLFIGRLPIRQEILNVSQIAATCHGIRPLFFIQS